MKECTFIFFSYGKAFKYILKDKNKTHFHVESFVFGILYNEF